MGKESHLQWCRFRVDEIWRIHESREKECEKKRAVTKNWEKQVDDAQGWCRQMGSVLQSCIARLKRCIYVYGVYTTKRGSLLPRGWWHRPAERLGKPEGVSLRQKPEEDTGSIVENDFSESERSSILGEFSLRTYMVHDCLAYMYTNVCRCIEIIYRKQRTRSPAERVSASASAARPLDTAATHRSAVGSTTPVSFCLQLPLLVFCS